MRPLSVRRGDRTRKRRATTALWLVTGALVCGACLGVPTGGETVEIELSIRARVESGTAPDFMLPSGWAVHLDEALYLLGPVYLRSPKQPSFGALRNLLLPRAFAHGGHAQTLREGQVIGEHLSTIAFDALQGEMTTTVVTQALPLDRLSVGLAPAGRSGFDDNRMRASDVAFIRGFATNGSRTVTFACGLPIEEDADELPENLEARRRIDQIRLGSATKPRQGDRLELAIHLDRSLEWIAFDELLEDASPCPDASSAFVLQWYLSLRRPDAFSAAIAMQGDKS